MCLEKTKPLSTLQAGVRAVNSLHREVTADYENHILAMIEPETMDSVEAVHLYGIGKQPLAKSGTKNARLRDHYFLQFDGNFLWRHYLQ